MCRNEPPDGALCIMVKRDDVFAFNSRELTKLPTPLVQLPFPKAITASSQELREALMRDVQQNVYIPFGNHVQQFKTRALVMLIQNSKVTDDQSKYVNGDRGVIEGWIEAPKEELVGTLHSYGSQPLHEIGELPVVRFERTKRLIIVNYHHFERKVSARSPANPKVEEVRDFADLLAIPLCLAWASTVHKVQGCTITSRVHVVCDLMHFVVASFYVALSRATDRNNVTLQRFTSEGKAYEKARAFYRGTYVLPPSNVMETIHNRVHETEKERQAELCDLWTDVLEAQLRKSDNKQGFIEQVQHWADSKRGTKRK